MSTPVLTHYHPKLPLQLAGDVSAYGMGAVISHLYPNGSERPIAYTSRTFTAAERNYAQIEKEAYSLVFGVRKFYQCCTVVNSHCILTTSLITILGPKKGVPTLAAARLQRWALSIITILYLNLHRSMQMLMACQRCLLLPAVPRKNLLG